MRRAPLARARGAEPGGLTLTLTLTRTLILTLTLTLTLTKGVWGVSAFLGSTLGPLIAGPLLTHFGGCWTADCAATAAEQHQYSTPGYVAVMLLGAVYVICAGLMLRTVKAR